MGYSLTAAAGRVQDRIERACRDMTGSQNLFRIGRNTYMIEWDTVEHDDGGVAGVMLSMDDASRSGRFHIAGEQPVSGAPVVRGEGWAIAKLARLLNQELGE